MEDAMLSCSLDLEALLAEEHEFQAKSTQIEVDSKAEYAAMKATAVERARIVLQLFPASEATTPGEVEAALRGYKLGRERGKADREPELQQLISQHEAAKEQVLQARADAKAHEERYTQLMAEIGNNINLATTEIKAFRADMQDVALLMGEERAESAVAWTRFWQCCRRQGVGAEMPLISLKPTSAMRKQWASLWLGQYTEVQKHFTAGKFAAPDQMVATKDIREWLDGDGTGKTSGEKFFRKLCTRMGIKAQEFSGKWQVEHLLNGGGWEGRDHPFNFAIISREINIAVEFLYGPSDCKMIMIGKAHYEAVQRFNRWMAREGQQGHRQPGEHIYEFAQHADFKAKVTMISVSDGQQSIVQALQQP